MKLLDSAPFRGKHSRLVVNLVERIDYILPATLTSRTIPDFRSHWYGLGDGVGS